MVPSIIHATFICGLLMLDSSIILLYFIAYEQAHLSLSVIFL